MHVVLTAIPFRTDPAISTGHAGWVVLVTGALLVATFLILSRIRRKGWLDKWMAQQARRSPASASHAWVVESQRINRNIVVHTLERSGQVLVLVESRSGVSVATLPPHAQPPAEATP